MLGRYTTGPRVREAEPLVRLCEPPETGVKLTPRCHDTRRLTPPPLRRCAATWAMIGGERGARTPR